MALKDDDLELAQRSCEELYRRHAHLLLAWCLKNRAETYGQDAKDLVQLAMLRAFDRAHQFQCPNGLDLEARRQHVRLWLFKILRNAFLDSRKNDRREPFDRGDHEGLEEVPGIAPASSDDDATPSVPGRRRSLVIQFIETLEGVDKAILIATAECWSPTVDQTVLSREVRRSLCEEFGLNENSLRVRRSRLLAKLRLFISEEETKTSTS
jgi:RNA polymerase sigma factor (sigma-70 family)